MLEHLFATDITRDITAVVYFQEDAPGKLAGEVSEYIVTGGYPESDPRHQRVPHGIHEGYVRLLSEMARQRTSQANPACWISGFYGSGKSSFAKLLGLSLDGRLLPDGTPLSSAWLDRDRSPLAPELREAWKSLTDPIEPIAVVFDIGGTARADEHIHATAVRKVQERLGYSNKSIVARAELGLEQSGKYDDAIAAYERTTGESWQEQKNDHFVADEFSRLLHVINPDLYSNNMSWVRNHEGKVQSDLSPSEACQEIAAMLDQRAPGATLFLVVDEVSQYIHQDDGRMLKLQSFIQDLGARLKGRVWLLVTGQEQLDAQNMGHTLGKLKDRFPASLRVHLSSANIRDVVHRRLLEKTPAGTAQLKALFHAHRTDLKLYALDCEHITEADFVEVYPMLPGHVDLLLEITQALRNRATRSQGDDHAIRGLLQLLGELFRTQKLAQAAVGRLITLDDIFAVQQSALPGATQKTLTRIAEHCTRTGNALALRCARAVSLLELIAEQRPTTAEFVAQALFDRVDCGNNVPAVKAALQSLKESNLLAYSDKRGFKLQSSSGQEWETERIKQHVPAEHISRLVQECLTNTVLPKADVPRYRGVPFKIEAWYSDGRNSQDVQIKTNRNEASFGVDLRFISGSENTDANWVRLSSETQLRNRAVWAVGSTAEVTDLGRNLARSRYMVGRYDPQRTSLSHDKLELLNLEQSRQRDLERAFATEVERAFMIGHPYFRGQPLSVGDLGSSFASALSRLGERLLPDLYPHFEPTNITQGELDQLLDKQVMSGVSAKFLQDGLGLLTLDGGRYEPTCDGPVPSLLLGEIESQDGLSGGLLFTRFSQPPYGFSPSLLRACLAGLLRAKKIQIRTEGGKVLGSHNDPGVKDQFRGDRALRRSEIAPASPSVVKMKDRIRIKQFFTARLQAQIESDSDAIADAVFAHFPVQSKALRHLLTRMNRIPAYVSPEALRKLTIALEDTQRSRHIEPTVQAVKKNLDTLNDGIQLLNMLASSLTDSAVEQVVRMHNLVTHQLAQLTDLGPVDADIAKAHERLTDQLKGERPWNGIDARSDDMDAVVAAYMATRTRIHTEQVAAEEAARDRIRARDGFDTLTGDQRHQVLHPIAKPSAGIDGNAVQPTLRATRAQAIVALQQAEADANERLDELLNPGQPVVQVNSRLGNRLVDNIADLDRLLQDLRARVVIELNDGKRVRLK